ncbi:MAG TPA: NADH-quinone oxidoreductase subunit I [Elusimicrobia bacterium]|nr:NADH-quinone oxidoreductase subunit I [Elusimicrobiota bacterium]HBT61731.1 NADH-quinone oxidoreductase subunit I [Elusimicrobiota bacterium]
MVGAAVTAYFKSLIWGSWAFIQGLWITLRYMFKPSVTVHYPTEKLVPYDAFRGALLFDPATCIACGLCAKACPSGCISLESQVNCETKKRVPKPEWYALDMGKCQFCGLCQEACPTKPKSVWHSLDYELAFCNRGEMIRCWKQGFPWGGRVWDPRAKTFKDPKRHISVREVQARK